MASQKVALYFLKVIVIMYCYKKKYIKNIYINQHNGWFSRKLSLRIMFFSPAPSTPDVKPGEASSCKA